MKLLALFYTALRALLITGVAGGTASSQERGYVDQEEADWDAVLREALREGGGGAGAFRRYLEEHPTGPHAPKALEQILRGPVPSLGPAPAAGPEGIDTY